MGTWHSTSFTRTFWDPRASSCRHMAHKIKAVTRSTESVKGQGASPSPTQSFNLLTAEAVFCRIFGITFETVKKANKQNPQYYSPESPHLQRERDLVRVPMGDSASHPLLFPRDIRHQPEYVLRQLPSPCHSSVGKMRNMEIR